MAADKTHIDWTVDQGGSPIIDPGNYVGGGGGGGGGGALQYVELADVTFSTTSSVDVDCTGYDHLVIIWDDVDLSASGYFLARVSTDGVTFDSGASDYRSLWLDEANNTAADSAYLFIGARTAQTTALYGRADVRNLSSSSYRTQADSFSGIDAGSELSHRRAYRKTAQTETHIRILPNTGNFSSGRVRVLGVGPGNFGTEVTTTDATVTTCGTIATANDTAYHVTCVVTGRETVDSDEVASYELRGTFRNDGGTLALVGTVTVVHSAEDTAGWNATLDASGTDIRCRVTGAAATNIDWISKLSFEVA